MLFLLEQSSGVRLKRACEAVPRPEIDSQLRIRSEAFRRRQVRTIRSVAILEYDLDRFLESTAPGTSNASILERDGRRNLPEGGIASQLLIGILGITREAHSTKLLSEKLCRRDVEASRAACAKIA